MNQPNDHNEQPKSVEERLYDLEQLFGTIIKNEMEIIKLSQHHKFNLREISGAVGSIQLDVGDLRERFDTIDRTMATKEDIGRVEARFERMEVAQTEQGDLLKQQGEMLRQIWQFLQKEEQ